MRRFRVHDRTVELLWGARCRFDATVVSRIPATVQASLLALPRTAWKPTRPGTLYRLGIWIVSEPTIRELNTEYRKKARPTDVLSFSQLEETQIPFDPEPEIGDVVICGKIARSQSKQFGLSLAQETQRLAVHGLLHLFGYDHETNERDAKKMFSLQRKILDQLWKQKTS